MALPLKKTPFDVDDYVAWEEVQEARHEYVAGEIFAMSGGTDARNTIGLNLAATLKSVLRQTPCRPFVSGTKLRIDAANSILYPDIFVTCDPRDKTDEAARAKSHHCFIAEVLSESTGAYDRGRKFELYQKIPELQEFLLIEQERLHADLFRKNAEGFWVLGSGFWVLGSASCRTSRYHYADQPQYSNTHAHALRRCNVWLIA